MVVNIRNLVVCVWDTLYGRVALTHYNTSKLCFLETVLKIYTKSQWHNATGRISLNNLFLFVRICEQLSIIYTNYKGTHAIWLMP